MKLFLLSLTCLLSSAAFSKFDGAYVGLTGGGDSCQTKVNAFTSSGYNTLSTRAPLAHKARVLGLVAGYGVRYKAFLLRAEVGAEKSNGASGKDGTVQNGVSFGSSFKIKEQSALSFCFMPSLIVDEKSLIYLKAGLVKKTREIEYSTFQDDERIKKHLFSKETHPLLGVGYERKISKDLHVGFEYFHTFEKKINFSGEGDLKIKASEDSLRLRLILKI